MTLDQAAAIRHANWWMHGMLALAFTAAIPWYKAKHIIAAVGSLIMRDAHPLAQLPPEPEGCAQGGNLLDRGLHLEGHAAPGRLHQMRAGTWRACPAAGGRLSPEPTRP